jgi:hypothetical protein
MCFQFGKRFFRETLQMSCKQLSWRVIFFRQREAAIEAR